jgi:hypothetical protein
VRNYRQARDRSTAARGEPAPLFALELAAAELRAGRPDAARARADGAAIDARTWNSLPRWAQDALAELGLAPESP